MKKNLVKLALSGAALAAVAATLGTSTYAWYTTNPTVNANNIIGASADSGASSIFISKDTGNTKNWSQTVKFADNAFTTTLTPAQPGAATGSFLDLAGESNTDVIKVQLYFKTSKTANDVNLYIKELSITNTTTTLPTADNMLYNYVNETDSTDTITVGGYGVSSDMATYSVDFVKALGMQVDAAGTATDQTFSLASYETADKTGTNTVSNPHAHEYYNKVMPANKQLSSTAVSTGQAKTTTLTKAPIAVLPAAGTAVEVDFYIFLNGWNDYCYDACQGQQFTLNMSFTSELTNAAGA
jgi:hypothetical protein